MPMDGKSAMGPVLLDTLSCYGIRSAGGSAYVTGIPGYGRAGATPETARSSFAVASEPRMMAWKPLRDRIRHCTLV
jgi:hypothetical protein